MATKTFIKLQVPRSKNSVDGRRADPGPFLSSRIDTVLPASPAQRPNPSPSSLILSVILDPRRLESQAITPQGSAPPIGRAKVAPDPFQKETPAALQITPTSLVNLKDMVGRGNKNIPANR